MAMSRTLYSRPLTVSTVHIADAIFADVFVYVGEGEVVRKSEAIGARRRLLERARGQP